MVGVFSIFVLVVMVTPYEHRIYSQFSKFHKELRVPLWSKGSPRNVIYMMFTYFILCYYMCTIWTKIYKCFLNVSFIFETSVLNQLSLVHTPRYATQVNKNLLFSVRIRTLRSAPHPHPIHFEKVKIFLTFSVRSCVLIHFVQKKSDRNSHEFGTEENIR